jgi:3'-phosphoadenosine 5'-phosphosulfate sulfotransferase (PAPS reductase)/FAD synthetase
MPSMTDNPYRIEGPALVANSGGRTSARMLKGILDAHDGNLPEDVHVVFCNTGKERAEALRFVHECETRWGVPIHWLEWRDRRKGTPVAERFEEVGFNSAARNGEPFKALIKSKKALPNAVARWCTEHLKMQVCADFMEARGYTSWTNVVGLRADEMRRVARKVVQNETGKFPWRNAMPLVRAGVTKLDVRRFWFGQDTVDLSLPPERLPQGFDLGLEEWEGNCTMCFEKGWALAVHEARRDPADAEDWASMEESVGATFTTEWSIRDAIRVAASSPFLPFGDSFRDYDAECGIGGIDHSIRCGKKAA